MGHDMVQGKKKMQSEHKQGPLCGPFMQGTSTAPDSVCPLHLPSVGNFDYQIRFTRCLISSYPEASVGLLDESPSHGKEPAGWEQSPLQSCLLLAQQMEWRAAEGLVCCQGSSFTHIAYPA
jgi:hypothetical protein